MNWKLLKFIGKYVDNLDLECLLVGGAIRDYLLGKEPKDYDFVCNDSEKLVNAIEREHMPITIARFKKYGTYQFKIFGYELEFVNPRKEAYMTWSHKPICEEGTILDDILRRDFTINTLAIKISENVDDKVKILDYTKRGLDDFNNNRLECVGNPLKTFTDDPSRLIRLCIYASKGFNPSNDTKNAAISSSKEIKRVPLDAIKQMMDKGIVIDGFLVYMFNMGILEEIIPEIKDLGIYEQPHKHHKYNVLEHIFKTVEFVEKEFPVIRWAALFHDIGKKTVWDERGNFHGHEFESEKLTKKILFRMRFSNSETKTILHLVRNHMKPTLTMIHNKPTKKAIGRFFRKHEEYIDEMIILCKADIRGSGVHIDKDIEKIMDLYDRLMELKVNIGSFEHKFKLNYNGNDIMETFKIKPSPLVGDIKSILEEKVCSGELENIWEDINKYANKLNNDKL